MQDTLLWGPIGPEESQYLAIQLIALSDVPVQRWQSIREPDQQLWFARAETVDALASDTLLETIARAGIKRRVMSLPKQWQSTEANVANFVLRELAPESVFEVLPQIHRQIEAVATRPGCVGCTLASEVGKPQNFLGGTYWQDETMFKDYADWAAQHAWRDVITPVTRNVPLRMLARRID